MAVVLISTCLQCIDYTGCSKSNSTVKTDLKDTRRTNVILFISNQTFLLSPTK